MKRVKFIKTGYETVMKDSLVANYEKKKKPVIKVLGDAKEEKKEDIAPGEKEELMKTLDDLGIEYNPNLGVKKLKAILKKETE